ncbi:hypothetical protein [Gordonia phage MerCougar]|nr:hypothetical protein [Gordonia phage MerCougar]
MTSIGMLGYGGGMNTTPPYPAPEGFETLGFTDTPNPAHEKLARERMEAFPEKFKTIQVSFGRQCGKRELKGVFDEYAELGLAIGSEAHKQFEEAMEKFARETLPPFNSAIRGLFQTIEGTWREISPTLKMLEEARVLAEGKPIHPKDLRDERGVKQPSPVPPFWAASTNGRRR